MSRHDGVVETLLSLQQRIISLETTRTPVSETDTRQGLINPLFRALGWDFGDFVSVKSEVRHKSFNEPVDYAFYSSKDQSRPILLLEAKKFGTDLGAKSIIKQICEYMGEFGVQWGVISDGNKYVLYNSRGGDSFEPGFPKSVDCGGMMRTDLSLQNKRFSPASGRKSGASNG